MDLHTVPLDTPIVRLEVREAFEGLTERERLYCYYLARAAWEGSVICLFQTSPESPPIFLLLRGIFASQSIQSLREAVRSSLSDEEFKALLMYACGFFANMGNYKGFGDTKIVPGIAKDTFRCVVEASAFYQMERATVEKLWVECSGPMYSLTPRQRQLGLGTEGITTYYSGNCSKEDASFVQGFMVEKGIEPYNTRLFKTVSQDGSVEYCIKLASASTTAEACYPGDKTTGYLGKHSYKGTSISVTRGDYAPILDRVIANLNKAKAYAANEHEELMLEAYVRSFQSGCVEEHKNGSRHWIKNKGPVVETYIGFIETYRDPFGVRGEYEGFVAVVNKSMSAKFSRLVASSESLLPLLPWPREFEKDKFLRPDFTSLDIVSYGSTGIPAGINIPNCEDDEIRQNEGFKNVSLGNVLSAAYQDKRVSFLGEGDAELYRKLRGPAFEVQVGLHELLGHGSGKLLKQEENGEYNFDHNSVRNPLNGEKVSTWYGPGETWDSKFSVVASSYEECRAECVGIYLCLSTEVLSVFGYEGSSADDIVYVNWLNMVRAGVVALEFYTPETRKWRQAHMQARFVILRVLLENAPGLVTVEPVTGPDGIPDLLVQLDRSKIQSHGQPAIGDFLKKLQVFKSLADVESGAALYDRYSEVEGVWLERRRTVLERKMPRKMLVQALTVIRDGGAELLEFEASPEGMVQSYVTCFPQHDSQLEALWLKEQHLWLETV